MARDLFTFDWGHPTSSPLNYSNLLNDSMWWWMKRRPWEESGQGKTWMLLTAGMLSFASVIGNAFVILVFLGWSKLRTGQNIMLVNVSIADLFFVLLVLPPAIVTNVGLPFDQKKSFYLTTGSTLCRTIHYVLSACLYVAIYSPVAACVFRFFTEMFKRGRIFGRRDRGRMGSSSWSRGHGGDSTSEVDSLTTSNAVISCAVIWLAFLLANINVLYGDTYGSNAAAVVGLHQPSICNDFYAAALYRQQQQRELQGMSLQSLVYKQHMSQQDPYSKHNSVYDKNQISDKDPAGKMRTLWLIFLVSAFLIPLAIISLFSGLLLFWIQCRQLPTRDPITNVIAAQESTLMTSRMNSSLSNQPVPYSAYAVTTTAIADYSNMISSKRDAVVLIMAVSVARSLCWLPVQICLLVDVFGLSREDKISALHQKAEVFGICFALLGCAINPIIFYCSVLNFRQAVLKIMRRLCQKERKNALTLERLSAARNQSRNHFPKTTMDGLAYGYGSPGRAVHNGMRVGPGSMRRVESDANETILSIISDSSNRINYSWTELIEQSVDMLFLISMPKTCALYLTSWSSCLASPRVHRCLTKLSCYHETLQSVSNLCVHAKWLPSGCQFKTLPAGDCFSKNVWLYFYLSRLIFPSLPGVSQVLQVGSNLNILLQR